MTKVSAISLCLFLTLAALVHADVTLPAIFGDHMVLQQDIKIPVWGTAEAGEVVTVTLGDHSGKATADAAGKWRVDLEPVRAEAPLTLTVTGKNSVKFEDVLVGDNWICSGQSNMHFSMNAAHNAATEIPTANDPQLRLFIVGSKVALEPTAELAGKWAICTPDSVKGFSAVGYFFGKELRSTLKRPIGLIETAWGGMPAQAFTSLSALQKDPPFANYVSAYQGIVDSYPKAKAEYPAALAAYTDEMKKWQEVSGAAFKEAMKKWQEEAVKAKAAGQPAPPKPEPSTPVPKAPASPEPQPSTPSVLYNGMVAPLIPYGIKGVIWYQGESNGSAGIEYRTLFPRMISDWREKWGEGDFPFLYVQLAGYGGTQRNPSEGAWPYLREAQLMTLLLPNTGMASALDIGGGGDIHPKDKLDVGLRLALAAKHVAYGQELVYSGPIYDAMKIEGNKIRVTFKDFGGGLQMGVPPWTSTGIAPPAPTELTGFAIAGADKKWSFAKAQVEGNAIVVSSEEVASPVAVRYGWSDNPTCNLYNKEGLPASPFRTDDWPQEKPAPRVAPTAPGSPAPSAPTP